MSFLKRIRLFLHFDTTMKKLIIEAYVQLGWSRILKSIPFAKVAPNLGKFMEETEFTVHPEQKKLLQQISEAVHLASRYTFWESQCMVKAIAAMNMLKRRGIESTIYFGTAKDEKGVLIAHAWLRSGSIYISGAEEMNKFTVVGKYAKQIT
ncbi:lasso peptide biosynthesis B2 protein [Bacillus sp. E(2018)]|uniref:lasso peptide biosynthesis B2 protein n=1 Tax=Bacillus sp. E(2018) TaxID=2502239 RepID=UPI0010F4C6DE|nr:lasso peptide biosynthesis B2 protein [Bacillus sp. E(2018)]